MHITTSSDNKDGVLKISEMHATDVSSFYLWGQVIDEAAAIALRYQNLLPLGKSKGISLWLDGSVVTNAARGDLCLGWCMKVVTATKTPEDKT